jgi:predicted alpha/beta-hydrolase family hydrolase
MNAETFACTLTGWSHGRDGHTITDMQAQAIDTPRGRANAFVHEVPGARAALVLGHGAGGSVTSRDLLTVRDTALAARISVALIEQPYRVAGRRAPSPAAQLDEAWSSVVEQLCAGQLRGLPVLAGGRSSGARVACRTAQTTGAAGVLCLAFPLQPPRRASASTASASRLGELASVRVPVLVVQGVRDPFGMPPAAPGREVVEVAGDHRLSSDLPGVAAAVGAWFERVLEPSSIPF